MKNSRLLLIPGRALFTATLLYMILGCVAFLFNIIYIAWFITGIGIFFLFLIDMLLLLLLGDRLQARREIPSSFAQDETVKVKLFINRTGRPILPSPIWFFDLHPNSMSSDIFPCKVAGLQKHTLSKSDTLIFEYTLIPNERGSWFFEGLQFLLGSPLRFWKIRVTHEVTSKGRTYPNFKQIARGAKLKGKLEKGEIREIRKIRKRGQGMDFESLRDFQNGDSIRLIDWRASARNRMLDGRLKLIVKNYQEEKDQQVLFIIDSGY
ncbi:MAG: DUF58 domain-containing protein, partial [Treponema sp.]|nr:DUF58 domain-containing protein [Treponema sp.]